MKNEDFYEVVSLHSMTDNFVLNKFPNGDDIWLEIYHHDNKNGKKSASWDNDVFILNAHKILEKYVKFNKIDVDDVNDFNQILEDICKEDLEELYEMISYAIKLEYFSNVERNLDEYAFYEYILKYIKQDGHILFQDISELTYIIDLFTRYNHNSFKLTSEIWEEMKGKLYISEYRNNIVYGYSETIDEREYTEYFKQLKEKFLNK